MKLSLKRYSFILSFQLFFLTCDVIFNCSSVFFKEKKSLTFLYFLQDSFLLLLLASLVYSCYSTTCYQVGLTEVINRNFRLPVLIIVCYIIVSISLHLLSSYSIKDEQLPKVMLALFVIQKSCKFTLKTLKIIFRIYTNTLNIILILVCPINLYFAKRSILIIADPRYYQN